MSYELIKQNFDRKLWTAEMVKMAVGKVITEEQYEEIVNA